MCNNSWGLTLFEEKADLVARGEEIVVADMVMAVFSAGAELGHRVRGQIEIGEKRASLVKQGLDGGWAEGVRDDEIAIPLEGGDLGGSEPACRMRGFCHGVSKG